MVPQSGPDPGGRDRRRAPGGARLRPRIAVIVPYRGGCEYRDRAQRWIFDAYRQRHPDWQLTLAPGPDPWVKAEPVNAAIDATRAEIVVVADADVWCDGLARAVEAVEDGAMWAIPHEEVRRLTDESTDRYMAGERWQRLEVARQPYRGVVGGGLVVARRETFQAVPMDPRFVGWGQEDVSWGLALDCLLGPRWRGNAALVHLWHPLEPRMTHKYGNPAGKSLHGRYLAAKGDPDAMSQLIEEIHVHRNAHQPRLRAAAQGAVGLDR